MDNLNEAQRLATLRLEARARKDWQEADRLRDEIASFGYKVLDTSEGFSLEVMTYEVLATMNDLRPNSIHFTNNETAVCLLVDGWLTDALDSVMRILEHTRFPIAILDLSQNEEIHRALFELSQQHKDRLEVVILNQSMSDIGWAQSYNKLIEAVTTQNVVVMDISTLFEGDAISPLRDYLNDHVVAVGWKGANVSADWLSFDAAVGAVDALLSYLFIVKRDIFLKHPFDPKAKFYRNADLEWSLQLRSAGFSLYAISEELLCNQGTHHGYHDSDEGYRGRESKRNYDRLLSKFRENANLLLQRNA
ncbi:MAG: hypothetical protein ACO3XJ_05460 [Candidatus Nanopelagicales bacterium]